MAAFILTHNDTQHDEFQLYEIGRYLNSNEAVWRILGFPIHERHPTVIHLSVHLENGQRVYFTTENVLERVQVPPETTLTAFVKVMNLLALYCIIKCQNIILGMQEIRNGILENLVTLYLKTLELNQVML
ncbi:hypothetical protein AVEN_275277-1 [Araneus ventricosus]|uniref:Uncharacterized protein n=1 Tax=Araneus ventricosus TaxID=182803 RepID=A0A4Y2X260_ARAVE|nr:hypothetical protein AVEN_275277-1 [Araneus ventricosus]